MPQRSAAVAAAAVEAATAAAAAAASSTEGKERWGGRGQRKCQWLTRQATVRSHIRAMGTVFDGGCPVVLKGMIRIRPEFGVAGCGCDCGPPLTAPCAPAFSLSLAYVLLPVCPAAYALRTTIT